MPHINKLYDFVVAPYIVYKDKVLLVNHPRYNMWIAPGGHIELDENPEQALYREIKEETGLTVKLLTKTAPIHSESFNSLPVPNYLDVHDANPPHRHISMTYFCIANDDKFVLSDEHTDMRWFTEEELDDEAYNLSDAVKFYSTGAIKAAS